MLVNESAELSKPQRTSYSTLSIFVYSVPHRADAEGVAVLDVDIVRALDVVVEAGLEEALDVVVEAEMEGALDVVVEAELEVAPDVVVEAEVPDPKSLDELVEDALLTTSRGRTRAP